jgi:hypothetical protein
MRIIGLLQCTLMLSQVGADDERDVEPTKTKSLLHSGRPNVAVFSDLPTPRVKAMSLRERARLADSLAEEATARKATEAEWAARDNAIADTLVHLWGQDNHLWHAAHAQSGRLPEGSPAPRSPEKLLCFSSFMAMLAGILALQVRWEVDDTMPLSLLTDLSTHRICLEAYCTTALGGART